jgi:class I lanthipeptide synthase
MTEQRCLYTLLQAPRESHEEILCEFVTPVAAEVRADPALDSLFFARFNIPSWQLRFRLLGRPDWVEGPLRERVERRLRPLTRSGLIASVEFAVYDREIERYGGEEGMALAERLFFHDSLACLDLLAAERQGRCAKSRREFSLALTERLLDLLAFDRQRRLEFYRYGYSWALAMKTWDEEEMRLLEERYQALRPGLLDLLTGEQSRDPEALWGGEEPARIAARWEEATRPVAAALLAAHAAGRVRQDLVYLAWSYAHMHCNRLGIDPTPEAILRYFLHRFYEDGLV